MIVVGMGGSGHDFSTCIFKDDGIISFIEDERVIRKKHSFFHGMGKELLKMPALNYCLKQTGIDAENVDYCVANNSLEPYYYARSPWKKNIIQINHHLSHACSAFFPSNFKDAAILVIDGAGFAEEKGMNDSISMWKGHENKIEKIVSHGGEIISRKLFNEMIDPAENSIGGFYHIATTMVGFGPFDEGKTMGLAPYGTDRLYSILRELVDYGEEGQFIFPLECINAFFELQDKLDLEDFDVRADVAWAAQKICEEAVINAATYLKKKTDCENLCYAGGVALNSVANYKLYKTGLFKNIFIQPAAGDNGTSIGSALYGAYVLGGAKRCYE